MLNLEQIKAIEVAGDTALKQIGELVGLEFREIHGSKHYTVHIIGDSDRLGILKSKVCSDGIVKLHIVPDPTYHNYTGTHEFEYSAVDGVDNSDDFIQFITGFKTAIGV